MKPTWKIHCGDALGVMKSFGDKSFDLCLTDPPFGLGMSGNPVRQRFEKSEWDNKTPDKAAFQGMARVSTNQIIWGGNYFELPPTQCFLIWNKLQPENFTLGMCELAWTSFQSPAKLFTQSVTVEGNEFHPTQKPVGLLRWCLRRYTKEGDTILDPFAGSFSTGVACMLEKRNFVGIELSEEYCKIGEARMRRALLEPVDIPRRMIEKPADPNQSQLFA
jgi:site-specific DNA-methyltransferase (adenine-specific)